MAHESLRGFLQIGFFVLIMSIFTAFALPSDSGEFVISICGAALGLVLIIGSLVLWRVIK
jgi:hypothetical protein